MKENGGFKKIAFWGAVALALVVIAYFGFSSKSLDNTTAGNTTVAQGNNAQSDSKTNPTQTKQQNNSDTQTKASESTTTDKKANDISAAKDSSMAITISKSQITSTASFFPYTIDGVNMEIIAVKATDGSIRTALNTCQVCYDSGRGYYIQEGLYLVCQNCGNRFHVDQVEKIKGGCNPVPVMAGDKTDLGDSIAISKDFVASQKQYFVKWKTR